MTMITPSYLGETIEYSSLHACRSTLEDPTDRWLAGHPIPPRRRQSFLNIRGLADVGTPRACPNVARACPNVVSHTYRSLRSGYNNTDMVLATLTRSWT